MFPDMCTSETLNRSSKNGLEHEQITKQSRSSPGQHASLENPIKDSNVIKSIQEKEDQSLQGIKAVIE